MLKNFIRLVERSPDVGDGWRKVSKTIMKMVKGFPDQSLIEWEENEDSSGRIRLTEKGKIVSPYL